MTHCPSNNRELIVHFHYWHCCSLPISSHLPAPSLPFPPIQCPSLFPSLPSPLQVTLEELHQVLQVYGVPATLDQIHQLLGRLGLSVTGAMVQYKDFLKLFMDRSQGSVTDTVMTSTQHK